MSILLEFDAFKIDHEMNFLNSENRIYDATQLREDESGIGQQCDEEHLLLSKSGSTFMSHKFERNPLMFARILTNMLLIFQYDVVRCVIKSSMQEESHKF